MNVAVALIIGIVQGLTEFLPVSSSGHMTIAEMMLGMEDSSEMLAFDVAMHAATLLAIVIYFGRRWARTLVAQPRLIAFVALACIPAVLFYYGLGSAIEFAKTSLLAVGVAFGVTAAIVIVADRVASRLRREDVDLLSSDGPLVPRVARSSIVGLSQAVALFPGVSRSGSTISAALLCGASREGAFAFSFLIGAPLMFGAVLVKARDISVLFDAHSGAMLAGAAAAFAAGLVGLLVLRRVVTAGRLWLFGVYAAALSLVCLAVSIARAVAANGGDV